MKKSLGLLGVVTSTALLAACGNGADSASDDGPVVVAGFYPFAFVAEQVMGDQGSVSNLTDVGAEPHDLELSPQQVAEIADADVVVYEQGFQPAVDEAVEQNAEGAVVEVTEVTELEDTEESTDSHAEEEHADEEHGDLDPHVWQDPTKLVPVARTIGDQLAEADPDNAGAYRANARALVNDLTELDKDFESTLADCERDTFVTSHSAFGYLARAYDLEMVAIAGITPDSEPSPARLAELRGVVEREGLTTVFTETLADSSIAETLAAEAGVEVGVLDPIEGLTDETADEDYLSLMRSNLTALAQANGCA